MTSNTMGNLDFQITIIIQDQAHCHKKGGGGGGGGGGGEGGGGEGGGGEIEELKEHGRLKTQRGRGRTDDVLRREVTPPDS